MLQKEYRIFQFDDVVTIIAQRYIFPRVSMQRFGAHRVNLMKTSIIRNVFALADNIYFRKLYVLGKLAAAMIGFDGVGLEQRASAYRHRRKK